MTKPTTVQSKSMKMGKCKDIIIQKRPVKTMGTMNEDTQGPPLNLRVTAFTSQGGRRYMEDQVGMSYVPSPDNVEQVSYFYAGVYDGHGGEEAAKYAKEHLMSHIVNQEGFWVNDDDKILEAIKLGFLSLQRTMMKLHDHEVWGPTHNGYKSTSGTTASICIFRDEKLYIGHVGDSRVVLGRQEPGSAPNHPWLSDQLTKDHKPEDPEEKARITKAGGKVENVRGVHRVCWKRKKVTNTVDSNPPEEIEEIPFLAVARSLGDFWSYNPENDSFFVSPEPDVKMLKLNVNEHRCVILASDGIWDLMNPNESVMCVQAAEILRSKAIKEVEGEHTSQRKCNPSQVLVLEALRRWKARKTRADNISVVTVILEDPGQSKNPSIPVQATGEPIHHGVDPVEHTVLECEDLHSGDVSSSDGDSGHKEPDLTSDEIPAKPTVPELQEQDVTSSSNEVSKTRKKAPRTPSPDITAPFWLLEKQRSSAFQRYRRRTPNNEQGVDPPVIKIGENDGTVSTPQRRRQRQEKLSTYSIRRRIFSSISDVADKLLLNREMEVPEESVKSNETTRLTENSCGPVRGQKRRINSMPMMVPALKKRKSSQRSSRGPESTHKKRKIQPMSMPVPSLKKRKSPRRNSGPNVNVLKPVCLDLEFFTTNQLRRVTRSQMKKNQS